MWVEPSFSMTDGAKNSALKKAEMARKLLLAQPLKFLKILVTT